MQIKRLLILTLVLLASIQGFSQSSKVNLTGVILTDSGQPAEGVSVALKGTAYSTLTNEKGEYELSAEPGNYVLSVTYVGYKSKQTKINLQSNQTAPAISIEEDMAALDEVQVTGKSKVQRVKEQAYNISSVDLKKLYNTSADLNQVLNTTTGIRVRESGGMGSEFKFSINGFAGEQVKFFLDGIPLDNYGSSFTLNNIPTNIAERIDVYKGVVPIDLGGDALGGAVNIVTNRSIEKFIDASYSIGSFNTHKVSLNTRFTSKKGIVTNLTAFGNYSDNDYKVDASIPDPFSGVFGPVQKVKHFHDGYKQAALMAEVGVKDKKYADYLMFGVGASANKKEIQQGITMLRVVGDAFRDGKNFVPSIKYKKTGLFTKNLTASLAASYNISQERVVDTSSARYDWSGNYEIKNYESGGEFHLEKTLTVFDIKSLQSNANLIYNLNDNNVLAFNYTLVNYKRKEDNEYSKTYTPSEPFVNKNILGLSYNLSALEKRLTYTAFGKLLNLNGEIVTNAGTTSEIQVKPAFDNVGYGTAAAYFLIPEMLQLKLSYEHAYRLPSAAELLGNGVQELANPNLQPEISDNINFGFNYKKVYKTHSFGLETSFIYRKAKDFIQQGPAKGDVTKSQSVNFANVRVTGVDGVVHYGYKEWFTVDVNATYQKMINMDNSLMPDTNLPNDLYNTQLPNTPILYGNGNIGFHFKKLKFTDDFLTVNLSANFSDSYYLNPPVLGSQNKKEIPQQLYYSAAIAYTLKNGRYNIALECNDITDAKLYDYYKVQKPGRAFTLKLRYFFM